MSFEKAIEKIKEEFPNNSERTPEEFIKELKGETDKEWESKEKVRLPISEFLQKHLEADEISVDHSVNQTIHLTLKERITGKKKQDISGFIELGILFGVLWQHYDIIKTLKEE